MITTSSPFKTAIKSAGRQFKAYINDSGTYIRDDDNLVSLKLSAKGDIGKAVMRSGEAIIAGEVGLLGRWVNIGFGVVLPDTSVEYIDYGSFKVVEQEYRKDTRDTKIKLFDKMYETSIRYDLDPIYDIVFPVTLKQFLEAICLRLGWTLATPRFPNYNTTMTDDPFAGIDMTFRDVLDDVAEASASIIAFNTSGQLEVRVISVDGTADTLLKDNLIELDIKNKLEEVNTVTLAREPQRDYITLTTI
jgi:hypothetical protein